MARGEGECQSGLPMKARILVVDPNPDTRLLYKRALSDIADDWVEAEDGAEALGRALAGRVDLIVAEQRLARVTGTDLCAILRSDPSTAEVATILVSSNSDCGTSADQTRLEADVVLSNPCDPNLLASAARELLETSHGAGRASSVRGVTPSSKRRIMSHDCVRITTATPETAAPRLHCPECDAVLMYQRTELGGVNERFSERWDYFTCARCGDFQYRHRTRKLRQVQTN